MHSAADIYAFGSRYICIRQPICAFGSLIHRLGKCRIHFAFSLRRRFQLECFGRFPDALARSARLGPLRWPLREIVSAFPFIEALRHHQTQQTSARCLVPVISTALRSSVAVEVCYGHQSQICSPVDLFSVVASIRYGRSRAFRTQLLAHTSQLQPLQQSHQLAGH